MIYETDSVLRNLQECGCEYAFYFHRQGEEPVFQANCERFSSASIIKIPILLAWLALEREGVVDRSALCCLDDEPQVRGAGFAWMMQARQIPYHDVLLMMMALSDNLCTNLIIRKIGLERLNLVFRETLGLPGAALQRKLMDYAARERGLDNWVTAGDGIRLFELIRQLAPAERAWVDRLLRQCVDSLLLRRCIARDTVDFCHKTGSISGVLHDWGYTADCDIFLFTQKVSDEIVVSEVFGQAGLLLLE